ncbi:MAG: DUF1800 domain-containing protein [Longimicrobiales bacterium]
MPSLPQRLFALAFVCSSLSACAHRSPSMDMDRQELADARTQSAPTRLPAPDAVVHVLNRLTFGPRPGDVERVRKMGIERWIDQQLHPETIKDSAGAAALVGCPLWADTTGPAAQGTLMQVRGPNGVQMIRVSIGSLRLMKRDSARKLGPRGQTFLDNGQLIACRLARVEASERQLLEVLTDFWLNHFSIYSPKLPQRTIIVEWEREVIQPHALSRFRDLLGAVAHSPAMLSYLDNVTSGATTEYPTLTEYVRARNTGTAPVIAQRPVFGLNTGLNENYARELLELHTLGVDGGYTQEDVVAVARAFTGWSRSAFVPVVMRGTSTQVTTQRLANELRSAPASVIPGTTFAFDSARHDAGPKVVLGHTLPAGRGLEDGEDVLDLLARHPSTARFIARKLAVRFVSDSPPDALVDRAAATFLRTDGDIREVVRTIVTSPEFFSSDVHGAKIKSPLELVLSTRRALAAPVDTAAEVVDHLLDMDQPPFGQLTPEGWPETGADWMNARTLLARLKFATNVGSGRFAAIPIEAWPAWRVLSNQPFEKQMQGVILTLLHGRASAELRAAMMSLRPKAADAVTTEARQLALRELIALALGSPAFQRR